MLTVSLRKVQAANLLLSSWVLIFLTVGLIMEKWVELTLETKITISHSPWSCCTEMWPEEGDLELLRTLMISVFSLAFIHNLFLGLEYSYMIPETKYLHLIPTFLGLLTGVLQLCALLFYHHKLAQGQSVYFTSYKVSWVTCTTYLNTFCSMASGILAFLPHTNSTCMKFTPTHFKDSLVVHQSTSSIKVISLPDRTAMPRSIVRVHSKEARTQVPARRVTWAL